MYFKPMEIDTVYKVDGNICKVIKGGVMAILDGAIIYACGVGTVAVASVSGSQAIAFGKYSQALATAAGAQAAAIGGLYWDEDKADLCRKYSKAEALAEGATACAFGNYSIAEACVEGAIAIAMELPLYGKGCAIQFEKGDADEDN